jgi:RNA 2',3'-cyclic 3'-phosphodiesterase
MSSETSRIFIAIPIPKAVQRSCVRLISTLKNEIKTGVRWEVGEKIHITLRFLGDTSKTSLPDIIESLNHLSHNHTPLQLQLSDIGVFPNWQSPNVLWLGIHNNEALDRLQSDLEHRLLGLGYLKDKKEFHPHLTLGRVNRNCTPGVIRQIQTTCQNINHPTYPDFQTRHVVLFQSTLQRSGSIYQALHTVDLNKSMP